MLAEDDVWGTLGIWGDKTGQSTGLCIPPSSRELMMRAIVLGLLVAAAVSLPGYAAEPDGPPSLINENEALRIGVQGRLAAKPGDPAATRRRRTP